MESNGIGNTGYTVIKLPSTFFLARVRNPFWRSLTKLPIVYTPRNLFFRATSIT